MSLDNPGSTDETDKPAPVKPAPAETGSSTEVYDPDADALAAEALSEPPINWDADPVPVSRPGAADSQGSGGSAFGSADGQGQYGQDGAGAPGGPGARDQGEPQNPAPESGSSLEQPGNGSGAGAADGGAEVYDPDADALAAEALSEPPINWDADPVPVHPHAPAHDAGGEPGREPSADSTPTLQPTTADANSIESVDQDPVPSADGTEPVSTPSPAAEVVTEQAPEPASQDGTRDAGVLASHDDDLPGAGQDNANSETSEEPQAPAAERPEPPVVPSAFEDTGVQEPAAAEEAPPGSQSEETATVAEPVTGDASGPQETTEAEAEVVEASTTEHGSEIQNPEPAAESESTSDENGDADQTDAASGLEEETAEPEAAEESPHLEGDKGEGRYGDVSWVTLQSAKPESGDETPEEPEPEAPEDDADPEEAFKVARREALGMDPRPSGSELLEQEEKKTSKLDKLRRTAFESELIENTNDASEEITEPLDKLFDRPSGPNATH